MTAPQKIAAAGCAMILVLTVSALPGAQATESVLRPPATVFFAVSPKSLPKNGTIPVRVRIGGSVSRPADGSLPPALRQVDALLPAGIVLRPERLGSCARRTLEIAATASVKRACMDAVFGTGTAVIGIAGSDEELRLSLLVVKGSGGTVFVRASPAGPIAEPIIATVSSRRGPSGRPTMVSLRIPKVAAGAGALLRFSVSLGGTAPSAPIEATCRRGRFAAEVLDFVFNGHRYSGERLLRTCTSHG